MEERLLTEKQVSDLTSISLAALRSWRGKRKGFPFCKIGKSVRYPLKDLVSYCEKRKQCMVGEGD
jgi:predicted DNA-binding transcriptional regulator AlpA